MLMVTEYFAGRVKSITPTLQRRVVDDTAYPSLYT